MKDSILLDSVHVFGDILLSSDTSLLSQNIDTLVSGIPSDPAGAYIEVYPNPSRGRFTIEIKADIGITDIHIYDLNGIPAAQSIRTIGNGKYAFNITGKAKGIYILEVRNKGVTMARRKILIN